MWIRLLYVSLEEELGLWPSLYYRFLTAFPLFLHSLTSLIQMSESPLWNLGKAYKQNTGAGKHFCTWEGPAGSSSISISPFLWCSSILRGNKCGSRKGIKFWIKRLIINWAEKLSFTGTRFQIHLLKCTVQWFWVSLQSCAAITI